MYHAVTKQHPPTWYKVLGTSILYKITRFEQTVWLEMPHSEKSRVKKRLRVGEAWSYVCKGQRDKMLVFQDDLIKWTTLK